MSQASNYLETALLDHVLRNTAYTSPTTVYVGLFTADTNLEANDVANASEVGNANDYTRKAVTFAAAHGTNGSISTNANVTFDPANGGDWGTITHVAIIDGNTHGSGNVLFYGTLATSKTIQDGDTFQITTGNLTVTLA
mgnify:FL=1|tara:strand:- start:151 stop:567 length:417 start_codon:yes stop_codon:yes gene_type:complete